MNMQILLDIYPEAREKVDNGEAVYLTAAATPWDPGHMEVRFVSNGIIIGHATTRYPF
jgi:hypothetical protein